MREFRGNGEQVNTICDVQFVYEKAIELEKSGNKEEAFKLYLIAAEEGMPEAQSCVALCYEIGQGVDLNIDLAVEWNKRAAQSGDMYSKYWLGCEYISGKCIERDVEQGIQMLEELASVGYRSAFRKLGELYEVGNYVEKDRNKSIMYYVEAAEKGDKISAKRLENL